MAALRVMRVQVALVEETLQSRHCLPPFSYRTQAPLIDSLLNEIGVSGGSLTALTSPLTSTTPVAENVE
ncbi:hypothetical protein RCEC007_610063 [Escherichia coli]|nr:hypothetical protein RCEC007_610063 [Escherichia coli]